MKKAALGNNGRASSAHVVRSMKLPAMLMAPAKLWDCDIGGEDGRASP